MFNVSSTIDNTHFLVEFVGASCNPVVCLFENEDNVGCSESSITINVVDIVDQNLPNGDINLTLGSYDINIYAQNNGINMLVDNADYVMSATLNVVTKYSCII
jgi:hypothetical protein